MPQLEFFEIPSPCIGICESNSKGYCKGCLRSRAERTEWLSYSNEKKKDVIRLCRARKRAYLQKIRQAQSVPIDDMDLQQHLFD